MADDWGTKFETLKKRTEDGPNDGLAWSSFGDFLACESDNPSLAVRAFERARELLPGKDLRLRLGLAYVDKGDIEKGFAMMQASAMENPRAEAYCYIADAYLRRDCDVEAEAAARNAIGIESSYEEAHYLLGEALKRRNRAAAIAAYRSAVSLKNDYALAWQALGRELLGSNDLENGIVALRKAVDLDPDDVWSRIFLANGLWGMRQGEEANKQYLAAIQLAPEFTDLRRWYEEFLQHLKAFELPDGKVDKRET